MNSLAQASGLNRLHIIWSRHEIPYKHPGTLALVAQPFEKSLTVKKGTQIDESLGHWAARLSWASRGAMERKLRPHGLTPPMMAALLALSSGCERGTDLAKVMGVDAAAITRLLDRMADAGFISRCEIKGDRRSRKLNLSPAATLLLPALRKASAEVEVGLTAHLSAEEKVILIAQLKGLVAQAEKL